MTKYIKKAEGYRKGKPCTNFKGHVTNIVERKVQRGNKKMLY